MPIARTRTALRARRTATPPAARRTERRIRAVAESRAPAICRSVRGLRMMREDEMEQGSFYLVIAPPDAGDALNIQLDGNDMFVGPFSSPEDAQKAVGDADGGADVVDGDAIPVGAGGGASMDGEPPMDDMPPMESRRAHVAKVRKSVRERILREADAMMGINTSVANNDQGVVPGGGGTLDAAGAPAVANQTPQDAGGSTELDIDTSANINGDGMKGAELLAKPALGGADTGADPDLSGAGDGKGGVTIESAYGVKRGSYVTIQDVSGTRRLDSGVVESLTSTSVTLVGNTTYKLNEVVIRRRA